MPILNNSTIDPNKFFPLRYPWAREHYKAGVANNWVPEEIPMMDDTQLWKSSKLSEDERWVFLYNMGFFSTAESLTANNLVLSIYRHITDPACRQYLLRQAYEEALHTDVFVYICDSLGLDPDEIYGMYETNPVIKAKDDFVVALTKNILDPNFKTDSDERIQDFLSDLVGFYVVMEGIFFYAGFAMMLALKNQNKMTGTGQQFDYILRDESIHLAFGHDLISTIIKENPQIKDVIFYDKMSNYIEEAVNLEIDYIDDCAPNGVGGYTRGQFHQYIKYIADKRMERLGIEKIYNTPNPFPWMSKMTDLLKEKNFFETKVTEYSTGVLDWD